VPEVPVRPEGAPAGESPREEALVTSTGAVSPGVPAPLPVRRGKSVETLRKNLREIADALGPRDLDTLTAFAEFLKARRAARSFAQHLHEAPTPGDDEPPASQEIPAEPRSDSA